MQTLKGTQTFFVVNSVKLHLTALNSFVIPPEISREDEEHMHYIFPLTKILHSDRPCNSEPRNQIRVFG